MNNTSDKLGAELGQSTQNGLREVNEDSYICIRPQSNEVLANKGILAIIADGVGGSGDGREASQTLCSELSSTYYSTPDSWSIPRSIEHSLQSVNRQLYETNLKLHQRRLACTCSLLVLHGRKGHIFHVGDTRIYRLRGEQLECLTVDHYLPGRPDQLMRAAGLEPELHPDQSSFWIEKGDLYVMTSDGVHRALPPEQLEAAVRSRAGSQKLADELTRSALHHGHGDNATCQVLHLLSLPQTSRTETHEEVSDLRFPPVLDAGATLDDYTVEEELASGGMGTIYLASDNQTGLKVAIKCPNPDWEGNSIFLERFLREEWVGRRLHNQYLMRMMPPQKRRSKYLYLVMEVCRGNNLRSLLEEKKQLDLQQVLDIANQACLGLSFLHNMNIIHRDIKPDNLVLSPEGSLKIVDYGIVLLPDLSDLSDQSELVRWMGSPSYMAPELFKSSRGSYQSDIFALGVSLYELLTGHFPYGRVDPGAPYAGRSYQPLSTHRGDLPSWVDSFLEKAVALDPAQRFEAVSEALHMLAHPGDVKVIRRKAPIIERHPLLVWKSLTFSLAVICLLLLYLLLRLAR